MLLELSKRDTEWRKIALKICGCPTLADDLVNDMYLKMYKLQPEKFNNSYISYAIYHLYLNHLKEQSKTRFIEDITPLNLSNDDSNINERKRLNDILDELGLLDREILLHTHEKSLRETCEDLFMSYGKLHYKKKVALEKLENTNGIKKWKNER